MKTKRIFYSSLVIIALLVVLAVFYFQEIPGEDNTKLKPKESDGHQRTTVIAHKGDKARVIYAIVDQGGVYFGDERVDIEIAGAFLEEIAKKEQTRNVFVCFTDLARYGDAIRFYTGIDKSKFYVNSFPTQTVPIDYRLPLVGIFERWGGGIGWMDKTNGIELY